jgi:hypothetical protein
METLCAPVDGNAIALRLFDLHAGATITIQPAKGIDVVARQRARTTRVPRRSR